MDINLIIIFFFFFYNWILTIQKFFNMSLWEGNEIFDTFYCCSDKTFDLDLPDTEEEEPTKSQTKKEVTTITRGSNILNKVVATKDVGLKSSFTEDKIPAFGVLTDHESELSKIMGNISIWGLDVFSAARLIKDQRVLTSTAYKIFQERDLLSTFKIADRLDTEHH